MANFGRINVSLTDILLIVNKLFFNTKWFNEYLSTVNKYLYLYKFLKNYFKFFVVNK